MEFPHALVENLMARNTRSDIGVIEKLSFHDGLCHECNKSTPRFSYCHEMYGGTFKQTYGWYINKQAYEFGVEPLSFHIIPEICPQEILDLIELDPLKTVEQYQNLWKSDVTAAIELNKRLEKQKRIVWKFIENRVREKFEHKRIGEAWKNETILYEIVRDIFPDFTIFRHYRPEFLQGMELDIFIEELTLGIEYQGIQHFKPVKHWGGTSAFNQLQMRDTKKKDICTSHGIDLIYFRYDQSLSADLVVARLQEYIQ